VLQGCAALVVEREPPLPAGQWRSLAGQPGLVIGVPYARADDLAELLGLDLARQTGFGLVVARGVVPDRRGSAEAYRLQLNEVARGPLRLYVELRGGTRSEASSRRIEIAVVGMGRDEAWKLKTLFELIRDAHLRSRQELPRLDVLVEPARVEAAGAERTIQIRLPDLAPPLGREVYTGILAEFLTESSRLLLTRGK
jgi:hypothetical protein